MPRRAVWMLALAALLAVSAGVLVQRYFTGRASVPPPAINGYMLPTPRALTPAALVDDRGKPFSMADVLLSRAERS